MNTSVGKLSALEALSVGNTVVIDDYDYDADVLPPLVPEWDGEPSIEAYAEWAPDLARVMPFVGLLNVGGGK